MTWLQVTYRRSMNHLQWSFMNFLDALGGLAEGMEQRGIKTRELRKLVTRLEILQKILERKNELLFERGQLNQLKSDSNYAIDQRRRIRYSIRISHKINSLKLKLKENRYSIWLVDFSMPDRPAPPWLWSAVKVEER